MLIALAHHGVVIPADDAPTPQRLPNPATTNATLVREVLPWRCRDGRADSDYPLTAPDGGAEPTEEAR
jgi:hypothetical protein